MTTRKFISRFSPNRTDPEDLEKIHVQRHALLDEAVDLVRESARTKNKHHLLFVGARGCGKTHLLSLINHRLGKQEDLVDRLRIAWLNEDETSTSGNAIYYSSGGAGGSRDALPAGSDSDANDCETKRQLYYAAVAAAGQCDPAAAVPCSAYDGVECPTVGVNPDSVAALTVNLSEFKAAGCSLPLHSCPIWVMTPPPYTCKAGADGLYRCYSVCEQMIGGRATCVGQSTGCANVVLAAGFCSGTSMLCCSPY